MRVLTLFTPYKLNDKWIYKRTSRAIRILYHWQTVLDHWLITDSFWTSCAIIILKIPQDHSQILLGYIDLVTSFSKLFESGHRLINRKCQNICDVAISNISLNCKKRKKKKKEYICIYGWNKIRNILGFEIGKSYWQMRWIIWCGSLSKTHG